MDFVLSCLLFCLVNFCTKIKRKGKKKSEEIRDGLWPLGRNPKAGEVFKQPPNLPILPTKMVRGLMLVVSNGIVRPSFQQKSSRLQLPIGRSSMEGRVPVFALGVEVHPVLFNQSPHNVGMSLTCCAVKGGSSSSVFARLVPKGKAKIKEKGEKRGWIWRRRKKERKRKGILWQR